MGQAMSTPEELPVVAWRSDDHGSPHAAVERADLGIIGQRYGYPLTDHATATTAIAKLRSELEASRLECERLRVDAERWRTASSSRNLGIAFWGEHGQGVVYDKSAEIHADRIIKADASKKDRT